MAPNAAPQIIIVNAASYTFYGRLAALLFHNIISKQWFYKMSAHIVDGQANISVWWIGQARLIVGDPLVAQYSV